MTKVKAIVSAVAEKTVELTATYPKIATSVLAVTIVAAVIGWLV